MNHSTHLKLTDRYLYDEQFRERMQQDPVGTAESIGLPLDEEDRQAISNWDMKPENDELLQALVSKVGIYNYVAVSRWGSRPTAQKLTRKGRGPLPQPGVPSAFSPSGRGLPAA
jgi:hypothetical protein